MTTQEIETVYEIINPSDRCTLASANFANAACACLLIGDGAYGLNPVDGKGEEMPIFIFGGSQKWFAEKFDADVQKYFDDHRHEIADVLDSVMTGNRNDFIIGYQHAADKEAFRATWEEKNRTSMNAIEQRARKYAAALRKAAQEAVASEGEAE